MRHRTWSACLGTRPDSYSPASLTLSASEVSEGLTITPVGLHYRGEFPHELRELYEHPEKGFLGGEFFLYWRGPALVQYWRSFEDLERFARNPDNPHLPAWRRFNQTVGSDGSVGIWHETYMVQPGTYEAIYSK